MREQELCKEVLTHAHQSKATFPLLHVLNSYDSVLRDHGLTPDSALATNVYRVLLRWGRDPSQDWWRKYEAEFPDTEEKGLTVQDLEGSGKAAYETPSFDERVYSNQNARLFFKGSKPAEETTKRDLQVFSFGAKTDIDSGTLKFEGTERMSHSPPTRESPLAQFRFSLPKFREFLRRNKALTDAELIAGAFRQWKEAKVHKRFQTKVALALSIKTMTSQATKAWQDFTSSGKMQKLANEHFSSYITRKYFSLWTQLSLQKFKSRLSKALARKYVCQRYFRYWTHSRTRSKARSGLIFTAEFIHKQWLLKKSLIAFGQHLKSSLRLQIFGKQIEIKHRKWGLRRVVVGWRLRKMETDRKKTLYLKGYQESYRLGLKIGWRKLKVGVTVRKQENEDMRKARIFAEEKSKPRRFTTVLTAFNTLKLRHSLEKTAAANVAHIRKRRLFSLFQTIRLMERSQSSAVYKALSICRQTAVLRAWNTTQQRGKEKAQNISPVFLYCAYRWLQRTAGVRRSPFSPYSSSGGLSSDRATFKILELPVVFEKDAQLIKSRITRHLDSKLRQFVSNRILHAWKRRSRTYRRKWKIFRERHLKPLFLAWKTHIHAVTWHRFQLSKHLGEKASISALKIVVSWHKYASRLRNLRKIYVSNQASRQEINITKQWTHWRALFLSMKKRSSEKKLSENAFIQKYLGQTFSEWRRRLALCQKKQQLEHTGQKFAFQRLISTTWKQWRKRYISSLELNMTSEQLITNKEISRLAKVFASWQRITPLLRRSGYQRQMAGTKYNRKLAKRAVTALISYGAYAKHKNNVYSTALNRAKMLVKRNCLLALQIYADFRKKQSGKDAVLIPRLKTMIKGLRFKAWYSHALLFSSCRYLPELLSGLQKRQFLKRLRVVTDMQKLSDAYMQLHQEHALKTQVLQAWSQYVKKKADLVDKERTFRVRNRFYLKLVPYRIWRRAYVVERNIWTLYGLAVIRIKNDILKVCLRGWKLYRGYRLRKLYSRTHRDLVLKKQSLYAWEHLIKKSARLTHLREVAQTQIQQKIVRQVFYTWIMNAIKKQKCTFNYVALVKMRVRKLFTIWEKELGWRRRKGEVAQRVSELRIELAKKRAIHRLRFNVTGRSALSQSQKIAKRQYLESLKKRSVSAFLKHHEFECSDASKFRQIHSRAAKNMLKFVYFTWRAAAEPTIRKIQAAQFLIAAYRNSIRKTALFLWSSGLRLLKEIDKKCMDAGKVRETFLQRSAVKSLLLGLILRKEKRAEIQEMQNKENTFLMQKGLKRLQRNVKRRVSAKEILNVAETHRFNYLKTNSISAMHDFIAVSKGIKARNSLANKHFLHTKGIGFFQIWKSWTISAIKKAFAVARAKSHYRLKLLLKILIAFKVKSVISLSAKEDISQAKEAYSMRLKAKFFSLLQRYSTVCRSTKGIRNAFSFKISSIHSKILIGKALQGLRENMIRTVDILAEGRFRSAKLNLACVLKLWKLAIEKRRVEEEIKQRIQGKRENAEKRRYMTHWRLMRSKEFALKKLRLKLKRRVLSRRLRDWRRVLKLKFMHFRWEFAYKSSAFQALQNYAQLSIRAQELLSHAYETIQVVFIRRLFSKWRKTHHNWKKIKIIRHSQKLSRLRLSLFSWRQEIYQKHKLSAFAQGRQSRHLALTYRSWRLEQGRHASMMEKFALVLLSNLKLRKVEALTYWHKAAQRITLWANVRSRLIEPATIRRISTAYLSWKYFAQRKRMLSRMFSRYTEGKIYERKKTIFTALKSRVNARIHAEDRVSEKENEQKLHAEKRVFKSWSLIVKKKTMLADLKEMIRRKADRRFQRQILSLWTGEFRRLAGIKRFQDRKNLRSVHYCYLLWRRKLVERTHQTVFGRLVRQIGEKTLNLAFRQWWSTVSHLSSLEKRADEYQSQQVLKEKKSAFFHLIETSQKKKRDAQTKLVLHMSRAKRFFRLFCSGCKLSEKENHGKFLANEHRNKFLLLGSLVAWKDWMQRRLEAHIEADAGSIKAYEHYSKQLSRKALLGWAQETSEASYKQTRSRSYAIFSAWKMHTREMALLKKYLHECNLSDRYMQSSRDVHDSSRSSAFATLRSLGSSGTTTRELELSADRSSPK